MVTLATTSAAPGESVSASASNLLPGEPVTGWWTPPDNGPAIGAGIEAVADDTGAVTLTATLPSDAAPGVWHLTIAGQQSQRSGFASVEVSR